MADIFHLTTDWLRLAATPTFAIMALLTALDSSEPDMLCAAMHHASPLCGMVPMYLLMSAFHSSPWLKLICGRWGDQDTGKAALPSASNMV